MSSTSENKQKKQSLSEAFAELEEITREFEGADVDLEEGIPKFKRGLELARMLKKRLGEIENEIEEIKDEFKDINESTVSVSDEDFEEPEED